MKKLILVSLSFYQVIISPLLHNLLGSKNMCKYSVSCSEYAKKMIDQKGILVGSRLAFARILSCR